MLFVIHAVDKPGHGQVRTDNRPDHIAHLKAHSEQIITAGPTTSDDGSQMTGSLLIVDFPDRAAAERFAAEDPYSKAGLFERVEIQPWKKTFP
jgi:uncharacterized protein YciI